jgi:drug/metabolite transporter (DMT)-like permease
VIAFLAVFGTVVSLFLWNYGARHVSSASAGAFIYSLPLISVLSAVVILGERITLPIIIGGALILTGVAIAQFVPRSAAPGRSIGPAKVSEIAP